MGGYTDLGACVWSSEGVQVFEKSAAQEVWELKYGGHRC